MKSERKAKHSASRLFTFRRGDDAGCVILVESFHFSFEWNQKPVYCTHTHTHTHTHDKRTSLQYSKQMQYINTNVAVKRNIKNAHEYSYNARTMKCFLLYWRHIAGIKKWYPLHLSLLAPVGFVLKLQIWLTQWYCEKTGRLKQTGHINTIQYMLENRESLPFSSSQFSRL